jgi:hypothetical protein
MNDETTTLDQTDEDILTPTVSDEAIEAAAAAHRGLGPPYGTELGNPTIQVLPLACVGC